jgi:hypothetical protein
MTYRLCHRLAHAGAICTLCAAATLGSSPMRDEHHDHGPEPRDPATFLISAAPVASASSTQSAATRRTIYAGPFGNVSLRWPKS